MANHEARVISALLKNNDMPAVMGDNLPALFTSHSDIYDFIQHYYDTNKSLPPVSVVKEEFEDFDYLENVEGATKHYVESLREHQVNVTVHEMLEGALRTVVKQDKKPSDIVNRLSRKLSELQRSTGIARGVDIRDTDAAQDHYKKVREFAELHGGQPGIATGFKYMDEVYPTGMAPGHLGILMGYSGSGKTWFAIKLAINAWEQGHNVLMINLEMTPEELRDRIYFLVSQYSMDDLVKANIDPDSFKLWSQEYMQGKARFDLIGAEGGDFTTSMVQQKIEQYKPDAVFIDYMQLFWDKNMSTSDTSRAKNVSTEFKQIAMNMKVPVMVITAVTGKDKKDRINPPEIAQVAWSSQIEYDANLCFAVHTHRNAVTQKPESTEIVCRKNRHGGLFSFRVDMDLNDGVITELEASDQEKFLDVEDEELANIFDKAQPKSVQMEGIQGA